MDFIEKDLIEKLSGEGTGISKSGKKQVIYDLQVFQNWLTVGDDHQVPGRREIRGSVKPVFGEKNEVVTLELPDKSTLAFLFKDRNGTIEAKSDIESVEHFQEYVGSDVGPD